MDVLIVPGSKRISTGTAEECPIGNSKFKMPFMVLASDHSMLIIKRKASGLRNRFPSKGNLPMLEK